MTINSKICIFSSFKHALSGYHTHTHTDYGRPFLITQLQFIECLPLFVHMF